MAEFKPQIEETHSLAELEELVREATETFIKAHQRAAIAKGEEKAALQRLNDLQEAFSRKVRSVQKDAPEHTNWRCGLGTIAL